MAEIPIQGLNQYGLNPFGKTVESVKDIDLRDGVYANRNEDALIQRTATTPSNAPQSLLILPNTTVPETQAVFLPDDRWEYWEQYAIHSRLVNNKKQLDLHYLDAGGAKQVASYNELQPPSTHSVTHTSSIVRIETSVQWEQSGSSVTVNGTISGSEFVYDYRYSIPSSSREVSVRINFAGGAQDLSDYNSLILHKMTLRALPNVDHEYVSYRVVYADGSEGAVEAVVWVRRNGKLFFLGSGAGQREFADYEFERLELDLSTVRRVDIVAIRIVWIEGGVSGVTANDWGFTFRALLNNGQPYIVANYGVPRGSVALAAVTQFAHQNIPYEFYSLPSSTLLYTTPNNFWNGILHRVEIVSSVSDANARNYESILQYLATYNGTPSQLLYVLSLRSQSNAWLLNTSTQLGVIGQTRLDKTTTSTGTTSYRIVLITQTEYDTIRRYGVAQTGRAWVYRPNTSTNQHGVCTYTIVPSGANYEIRLTPIDGFVVNNNEQIRIVFLTFELLVKNFDNSKGIMLAGIVPFGFPIKYSNRLVVADPLRGRLYYSAEAQPLLFSELSNPTVISAPFAVYIGELITDITVYNNSVLVYGVTNVYNIVGDNARSVVVTRTGMQLSRGYKNSFQSLVLTNTGLMNGNELVFPMQTIPQPPTVQTKLLVHNNRIYILYSGENSSILFHTHPLVKGFMEWHFVGRLLSIAVWNERIYGLILRTEGTNTYLDFVEVARRSNPRIANGVISYAKIPMPDLSRVQFVTVWTENGVDLRYITPYGTTVHTVSGSGVFAFDTKLPENKLSHEAKIEMVLTNPDSKLIRLEIDPERGQTKRVSGV